MDQGAAESDIDDLESAADRHGRHLPFQQMMHKRKLELVALGVDPSDAFFGFGAITGRIDVATACEHHTVDPVEHVIDFVFWYRNEQDGDAAASQNRIAVRMSCQVRADSGSSCRDVLRTTGDTDDGAHLGMIPASTYPSRQTSTRISPYPAEVSAARVGVPHRNIQILKTEVSPEWVR